MRRRSFLRALVGAPLAAAGLKGCAAAACPDVVGAAPLFKAGDTIRVVLSADTTDYQRHVADMILKLSHATGVPPHVLMAEPFVTVLALQ